MTPTLTDQQWSAVKQAASWYRDADQNRGLFEVGDWDEFSGERPRTHLGRGQDFFLGGYAGTGKSTILPALIEEMGLGLQEVAFCAPTGKASKVMGQKLRAFGMNTWPTTIHKLIYTPRRDVADAIKARIDTMQALLHEAIAERAESVVWAEQRIGIDKAKQVLEQLNFDLIRAMDNDDGPKFLLKMREDLPEELKLLVVDEGSMVGTHLANDLATFGLPILAVGDPGQLPPVQDTYGFHCNEPDVFLTEIHRQAADNPIIRIATMVREGKTLRPGSYGDACRIVNRTEDDVTFDLDREAMVLCGTHRKRWTITKKLRTALGYTETGPGVDEPLLFCKNSQKLPGMVNGTIVTCLTEHGDLKRGNARIRLKVRDDEAGGAEYDVECAQSLFEEHMFRKQNTYTAPPQQAFSAKKQCEHLDWGYVLTVHKSQGSQWDEVVVHDESAVFREDAKRHLYTAVTRAAERLTVVL